LPCNFQRENSKIPFPPFPALLLYDPHSLRALNDLEYLAHPNTGCNRKVILPLYLSLIQSILDYGSPVYGLTPPSHLSLLDPDQNAAIRICTGAFCTSPQFSRCAEAGVPPLEYRLLYLTFFLSNSGTPQNTNPRYSLQLPLSAPFIVRRSHKCDFSSTMLLQKHHLPWYYLHFSLSPTMDHAPA